MSDIPREQIDNAAKVITDLWEPQPGTVDTDAIEVIVSADRLERKIHPTTWATVADKLDAATMAQLIELAHGGIGDV